MPRPAWQGALTVQIATTVISLSPATRRMSPGVAGQDRDLLPGRR
jgi:hypothetical protein